MPEGTSLEGSTEMAMRLMKELEGIEGVAQLQPTITDRPTHVHVLCWAQPIDQRRVSQDWMVQQMRERLKAHPSLKPSITVRNPLGGGEGGGGGFGYPINANLLGPDLDRLADYSMQLLAKAQKLPSLADPKVMLNLANPEVRVAVDRRRAADLGVRMSVVGNALRLAVSGDDEISSYREGTTQYPVKMRVVESQRRDIGAIGKLTVPSANGPVRIDNIARLERGLGPSALSRYNRQFSVGMNADLAPGHALDEAANDVRPTIAE